jgi:hypothetical protein
MFQNSLQLPIIALTQPLSIRYSIFAQLYSGLYEGRDGGNHQAVAGAVQERPQLLEHRCRGHAFGVADEGSLSATGGSSFVSSPTTVAKQASKQRVLCLDALPDPPAPVWRHDGHEPGDTDDSIINNGGSPGRPMLNSGHRDRAKDWVANLTRVCRNRGQERPGLPAAALSTSV